VIRWEACEDTYNSDSKGVLGWTLEWQIRGKRLLGALVDLEQSEIKPFHVA